MDTSIDRDICFVAMPHGRDPEQVHHFGGWYEEVIFPAVDAAGYRPVLASAEDRPNAINDEIRGHLASDPMAVFDLGGFIPADEPNPNVMYELGIRHAFNLPHVVMAWEGQRLPFDVQNQRAIIQPRDLRGAKKTREQLIRFIKSATEGQYYRPMDALNRWAKLAHAAETNPESVIASLIEEVRELRIGLSSREDDRPTMGQILSRTGRIDTVEKMFLAQGGDDYGWKRFVQLPVGQSVAGHIVLWTIPQWSDFMFFTAKHLSSQPDEVVWDYFSDGGFRSIVTGRGSLGRFQVDPDGSFRPVGNAEAVRE